MNVTVSIPTIILIVCAFVVIFDMLVTQWEWPAYVGAVVFFIALMVRCENTPEAIAERRAKENAEAQQALKDAQPHVIREADGCKVYTFKAGSWHYFTKCGVVGTVTTDRSYEVKVSCGKNCSRMEPHTETIITKEGQQ